MERAKKLYPKTHSTFSQHVILTVRWDSEWFGPQKWDATGLSMFPCLMSLQWPLRRMCSGLFVSPTYCKYFTINDIPGFTSCRPWKNVWSGYYEVGIWWGRPSAHRCTTSLNIVHFTKDKVIFSKDIWNQCCKMVCRRFLDVSSGKSCTACGNTFMMGNVNVEWSHI